MKKQMAIGISVFVLMAVAALPVSAQPDQAGEGEMGAAGQDAVMAGAPMPPMGQAEKTHEMHKMPGPRMPGGCPMCHIMMKGMMEKTLVPAGDGGVIVMAGNKLVKYDKDLNLVKEVEIKMDMTAMIQDMKGKCPMCKKMAEKKGMDEGAPLPKP